jgi:uncharacterized membrane protein
MLPGFRSMLNLHPLFVHFPIALWFSALLFEALVFWRSNDEWHRTAVRLLYLGTLGGIAAAFTGWLAQNSVEPNLQIRHVFEIHETIMLITTSFAAGLCIFCFAKRDRFTAATRRLLFAGLVILAILTTIGADRGVQLVYQYGQSVNEPSPDR